MIANTAEAPREPKDDFDYIRTLVRERSAIVLEPGKEYLAEARLGPLARQEGFDSLAALVARLRGEQFGGLHRKVVEAMTTNETSFFRDVHPFEALKKVALPSLIQNRAVRKQLNIWSAACSSGQEPYTIAMILRDHFPELGSWGIRILATDLSGDILTKARNGRFSQLEMNRGLPASLLVKHFARDGVGWLLSTEIRQMVDFRELNLAERWPALPPMDIIFLRNVLIYFDPATKKSILGRMRTLLAPDGYLFLGAAETTMNLDEGYERMQIDKAGCYRLKAT